MLREDKGSETFPITVHICGENEPISLQVHYKSFVHDFER